MNVSKVAPTAAVTDVEPGKPVRPPSSVTPARGREGLGIAGRRLRHPGLQARGQVDHLELVGRVAPENGDRLGRADPVDRLGRGERAHGRAGRRVVGIDRRPGADQDIELIAVVAQVQAHGGRISRHADGVKVGSTDARIGVQIDVETDHLAGRGVVAEDLGIGQQIDRARSPSPSMR